MEIHFPPVLEGDFFVNWADIQHFINLRESYSKHWEMCSDCIQETLELRSEYFQEEKRYEAVMQEIEDPH